jgi:hypothetical protein
LEANMPNPSHPALLTLITYGHKYES